MRKMYFFMALFFASLIVKAQNHVINLENLSLPPNSYWNGSDNSGGFTSNIAFFPNSFTDWGGGMTSWHGFAYSNMLDTLTQDFTNQYSTYAGVQPLNSTIFGISYNSIDWMTNEVIPNFVEFGYDIYPLSIDITNTTYAALSMLNGDAYSKKFGGQSGDDPDWFKLTITGYLDNNVTGSVDFYLADYRFQDNQLDYIVKNWTTVDLSPLNKADKISFLLSSSDTGMFGMNTPAYFCFDNIIYTVNLSQPLTSFNSKIKVYPNPVVDNLYISEQAQEINIYDTFGKIIYSASNTNKLNLETLTSGIYVIEVKSLNHIQRQSFIKQ